jgi:hypothetical protein
MQAAYEKWDWLQVEDGTYDLRMITKPLPAVRLGGNGRKVFFNSVIAAYVGWGKDKR